MDWSQYGDVSSNVQDAIIQASNATGVSDPLLARIANQESGFNPSAQSEAGATGLFQSTGDEVAYLVDAKGYKISAINPKEHVTIAFGCSE